MTKPKTEKLFFNESKYDWLSKLSSYLLMSVLKLLSHLSISSTI